MEKWQEEALRLRDMTGSRASEDAVKQQIGKLRDALDALESSYRAPVPEGVSHFAHDLAFYNGDRPALVTTRGLTKTYGVRNANDQVSITVKKGSIYGLIGRNGAGKTTWMKMVLGILRPDAGTVELFGTDPMAARRRTGFVIETPSFYDELTAHDNLMYRAKLLELPDPEAAIDKALALMGIENKKNDALRSFSLGQKQLLGLANAVLGDPELLILDEPVNGLDPVAIVSVRNTLLQLSAEGVTIVISSHILGELQKLATCYGFILDGRLVAELSEEDVLTGGVDIEEMFVKMAKGEME